MSYFEVANAYADLGARVKGLIPMMGETDPVLKQVNDLAGMTVRCFDSISASVILTAFREDDLVVPRPVVQVPTLDYYDLDVCRALLRDSERAWELLVDAIGPPQINDKVEVATIHGKHRMGHFWLGAIANVPLMLEAGYTLPEMRTIFGAEEAAPRTFDTPGGSYL